MQLIDLTGKKFGRLTVVERDGHIGRRVAWKCHCDCGNVVTVRGINLQSGNTKSCGCLAAEQQKKANTSHGMAKTKLYKTWTLMKTRCGNPNRGDYKYYGGRGIKVCDEWSGPDGFTAFKKWAETSGYADGLSIDRINNSKGYSPDNCRWVTRKEQSNNKRNNRLITIGDKTKTMAEWARITGLKYQTINTRVRSGLSGEELIKPVGGHDRGYYDVDR